MDHPGAFRNYVVGTLAGVGLGALGILAWVWVSEVSTPLEPPYTFDRTYLFLRHDGRLERTEVLGMPAERFSFADLTRERGTAIHIGGGGPGLVVSHAVSWQLVRRFVTEAHRHFRRVQLFHAGRKPKAVRWKVRVLPNEPPRPAIDLQVLPMQTEARWIRVWLALRKDGEALFVERARGTRTPIEEWPGALQVWRDQPSHPGDWRVQLRPDPDVAFREVADFVESLRAAGIEWIEIGGERAPESWRRSYRWPPSDG